MKRQYLEGIAWKLYIHVLYRNITPETREFVTRTVELWNRWIRLSCYYNRV